MSEPQYRVSMGGKTRIISATALAEFCLRRCGGGFNSNQVSRAMVMQRKAIESGKLGTNITIEEIKS